MKILPSPDKAILVQSFLRVRNGFAAEYVVCDPLMNVHFIEECRASGESGSPFSLNMGLLNLRKQGKLSRFRTTNRKPKGDAATHVAVQNAIRFLERQLGVNVDRVICDPALRDQFDSLVQILLPGCSLLESRYAALTLRKKNALKPEIVGRVIEMVKGSVAPIKGLNFKDLPIEPGVYLFFDRENTLYAGKADNLRHRIEEHLCTWTARYLLSQIEQGRRGDVFLVLHVLQSDINAQALSAYETEIIRSRSPSHNRAGKPPKLR
jgi:GIY-YIG catalytic domain